MFLQYVKKLHRCSRSPKWSARYAVLLLGVAMVLTLFIVCLTQPIFWQLLPCPDERYLFHRFRGRLGNVLFQVAAASCIAAVNNLTLVVDSIEPLKDVRHHVSALSPWQSLSPFKDHPVSRPCGFDPSLMTLDTQTCHHAVDNFLEAWKYFQPCEARIRGGPLFNDNVNEAADNIMAGLRKELPHQTLVGIHVRMEDLLEPFNIQKGAKIAPPDYYERAMSYFRSRFRDVMFVVIASSPEWFLSHVNASDIFMLPRSDSPAADMEVLARLDHIIMSVGTFGWWAAYRNKGTVIAYRDYYVPNSKNGLMGVDCGKDFFYPGWILM